MSLGICGTYNGSKAVLTCGHGNEKVGTLTRRYPYVKYINTRIGQVSYQQANTDVTNTGVDALGDFSIIPVTSSDSITNYVRPGVQITGTYSSVPVGTGVYKYGTSTGYSWGNITATNIRVSYTGDIFTTYVVSGLYSTNLTGGNGTILLDRGDSGGPVWRKSGSTNLLHGIVTAKSSNVMYSTPIYYPQYQGFSPKTN